MLYTEPFTIGHFVRDEKERKWVSRLGEKDVITEAIPENDNWKSDGTCRLLFAGMSHIEFKYNIPLDKLNRRYPGCKIMLETQYNMPYAANDGLVSIICDRR